MTYEIRAARPSDEVTLTKLSAEAFGAAPQLTDPALDRERSIWVVEDDGSELVAQATDIHFESWFGGARLATAGIGNVVVVPEHRGNGAAKLLMIDTLRRAHDRGAVLSTLFGGAPALYRRLGFELVASSKKWNVPISALRGLERPAGIRLRRAGESDVAELRALHNAMASEGSGMVDRSTGPLTAADEQCTVAVDQAGVIVGALVWKSSSGADGVSVAVSDLRAISGDALLALLGSLSTWGSVAKTISIQAVDDEPFRLFLGGNARPIDVAPYMLRVLDVRGAIEGRGWNSRVMGSVTVGIDDEVITANSGTWLLDAAHGTIGISATSDSADVTFSMRGLALWFTGVERCASIRRLGLLEGGSVFADALLDDLAAAPAVLVTEYF